MERKRCTSLGDLETQNTSANNVGTNVFIFVKLIEWLHEREGPEVIKQIKQNIRHALDLNALLRGKPLKGSHRTVSSVFPNHFAIEEY